MHTRIETKHRLVRNNLGREIVMGKLVVNGNSVYEVDESCMRKRRRKNKEDPQKEKRNHEDQKNKGQRNKGHR